MLSTTHLAPFSNPRPFLIHPLCLIIVSKKKKKKIICKNYSQKERIRKRIVCRENLKMRNVLFELLELLIVSRSQSFRSRGDAFLSRVDRLHVYRGESDL